MPTDAPVSAATELNSEVVVGTTIIVLATIGAGTVTKWSVNGVRKLNTKRVERKARKATAAPTK